MQGNAGTETHPYRKTKNFSLFPSIPSFTRLPGRVPRAVPLIFIVSFLYPSLLLTYLWWDQIWKGLSRSTFLPMEFNHVVRYSQLIECLRISASQCATVGLFERACLLPAVLGWPPFQWQHPTRTQYHFPGEKQECLKMHATVCWQSSYHTCSNKIQDCSTFGSLVRIVIKLFSPPLLRAEKTAIMIISLKGHL